MTKMFREWLSISMFSKNTFRAVLLLAAVLGQPAHANDITVPVDEYFKPGSLTITSYGKGYEFVIGFIGVKGEVFICGVGIYPDASSAAGVRNYMRRTAITMDGKLILRDLTFFAKAKRGADLYKEMATCRGTGVPEPKKAPTFSISWPSGAIRF